MQLLCVRKPLLKSIFLCGVLTSPSVWPNSPTRLDTLVVRGQEPSSAALSSSELELEKIPHLNPRSLADALASVPGVFASNQDNAAQGLRISIRGFGSRSAFGVRGVHVNLDGIPLSMPDGQTDLDAIDPGLLQSLQVIRGPSASLYGNGSGGVLTLSTRPAKDQQVRLGYESLPGAGRSERIEVSHALASGIGRAALAQAHYAGPRQHSHVDYQWQHLGWSRQTDNGHWQATFHGLRANALDPGGLTEDQVALDRTSARDRNIDFNAGESIDQQRLALAWQQSDNTAWQNSLQTWFGRRRFSNRLPFESAGQVQFDRRFAGLAWLSQHDGHWAERPRRFSFGLELQQQDDARQRFDNLLGGQRGEQQLAQDEMARNWAAYSQLAWQLGQRWHFDASLRFDQLKLEADDSFLNDGDDSGKNQLKHWSYALGLQRRAQHHRLFSRYSNSYETPTINELANPAGGGFNDNLKANRSDSIELGWSWQQSLYTLQWVLFSIHSKNELLPFQLEDQPGRNFYRNGGKTSRYGSELELRWKLHEHWSTDFTASYLRARIDGGENDDKQLPGLPESWLQWGAQYNKEQWSSRIQARAIGSQYADDGNSQRVPGYWRLDWQSRWQATIWGWPKLAFKLAVDNVLDARYNDNIRINAFGQRSFEPAAGTRARFAIDWTID